MPILTISRQLGSFGDEIAAMTAEKLGFEIIDQEQVHNLAEKCDPGFKEACSLYEREIPRSFWERFFLNDPAYSSLFKSLNYELASRGNVVIMGRGGQLVLGELPGVLNVRVVAPSKVRAERIMETHKLDYDHALDYVNKHTRQRRALIQQIFHQDLSDWAWYDMILNTAKFNVEQGCEIVCATVRSRPKPPNDAENKENLKRAALAKLVESEIRKKVFSTPYGGIEVESKTSGEVTLSGYVSDKESKDEAEEIARKFEGVEKVGNLIKAMDIRYY
jgi:cytidylate kinase